MNLFCFTLEGSTESIYEPACSQTLKEVLKYQCSPSLLTRKPEWGGSDPAINSAQSQNGIKLEQSSKQFCVPAPTLENKTSDTIQQPVTYNCSVSEKVINHTCCTSSADKTFSSHRHKIHNREIFKASSHNSKMTKKELTITDPPAQNSKPASDAAEPAQTTSRLKKLQNLVQAKKEHLRGAGIGKNTYNIPDVLGNSNPVLTCIGLGKRTEKLCENAPSPQEKQAKGLETSEEEDAWSPSVPKYLWSPFECPQSWTPLYHTCHQAPHELLVCGGTLSLPRNTEWDHFESLIQELDNKHCSPSPPQMIRSITDLHLSQNMLIRFGRFDAFRQQPPLMKPQDKGHCLQKQEESNDPIQLGLLGKQMEAAPPSDREHSKATPEETLTAITNGNQQTNKALKPVMSGGRPITKDCRRFSNSLESLYSSGQSSSSGVTSGSDCSSNRGSLRLEDDLLYTRQFCGRARVHTDHVPSPYDTESLKLKVGDVIDIISKPPMGIWTGMLNGRVGRFKFIYVDELKEESPDTHGHRVRHTSTVQEVLKRLSLEEYSSSLQLNGYQTVDDLISLKEHHLMELNVTDPEHKHRLLAAIDCLRQLSSDGPSENEVSQEAETPNENMKAHMNNHPRDSSCHMPPDSPDKSTEHTHLHFPSGHPQPAETTAS